MKDCAINIIAFAFALAVILTLLCVGGWVFGLVWNWVAPGLNWPILSYWQGVGIWTLIVMVGSAFK